MSAPPYVSVIPKTGTKPREATTQSQGLAETAAPPSVKSSRSAEGSTACFNLISAMVQMIGSPEALTDATVKKGAKPGAGPSGAGLLEMSTLHLGAMPMHPSSR